MSLKVTPRARRHADRNGDPLDGLVNMFDVGLVLAVGFLLAALQSFDLTRLLTERNVTVVTRAGGKDTITVKRGEQLRSITVEGGQLAGQGERVGEVYRLTDGRLVYVDRTP
jgi:hypothetical protein